MHGLPRRESEACIRRMEQRHFTRLDEPWNRGVETCDAIWYFIFREGYT